MLSEEKKLSLRDFAGLKAAGADEDTFNGTSKKGFDSLQVGAEFAQGFTDNFRTGTTGSFNLTAPFIFITWD